MSRRRNTDFHFSKERVSDGDTFRCRKCRNYLFSFENLTNFHEKVEPVDQCSSWYLSCDSDGVGRRLSWINKAVDESQWTEGKLYCPKCTSRIGSFNITQGVKCSCFAYIIPAVWIQKCKVDQITSADSKVNIRLPGKPTEPGSYQGNSYIYGDQTPQTSSTRKSGNSDTKSIHTSQTSSQTGQTGISDTACNNVLTVGGMQTRKMKIQRCINQTCRQAGCTCTVETCQTGFVTSANYHFDSCSESGPFGSSSCLCTGSRSFNSNGDTGTHVMSTNHASDALQTDMEHEPSPSSSGLQSEDSPPTSKIWPNVIGSYKVFSTHHCQNVYPCQFVLENHYEMYSNTGSSVYRRGKRTQTIDNFDEDYSGIHGGCNVEEEKQGDKQTEENEIPEHLICPICLDLLYEPLISPCDHVFCDSCLRILNSKCRKSVPRCPLCRKSLNYVYPAVDLREEIRKTHPDQYRKRHKAERRAAHRRLPLPSGRLKSRKKKPDHFQDVPMPFSVLVFLVCVLAVCVLCLVILFVFCPPSSSRCVTIIGYE